MRNGEMREMGSVTILVNAPAGWRVYGIFSAPGNYLNLLSFGWKFN